MQVFPVTLPSGARYWTVLDESMAVVPTVDEYLRHLRFGRDAAELTTKTYASGICLYLRWCQRTGRAWQSAAAFIGLFMTWLQHAPATATQAEWDPRGGEVRVGPGADPARGARRVNVILSAVRGFLLHAASSGEVPQEVLAQFYEVADARDLPIEARGIDARFRLRARHRMREARSAIDRATNEEIVALFRACHSARDRLIVALMARVGLRRGQLTGLRREDLHFLPDSTMLGCHVAGAHLHVVRRDNVNGAWSKSRPSRCLPVDFLVVQAHDQYVLERAACPQAEDSDFVLVNLFRPPLGVPMPPDAINRLITDLSRRAGLDRHLHPHMLRHAFGSNLGDAGAALDEIQELMGHASPTSSQRYLHPDPDRLRSAIIRVPSPRLKAEG
ncbi:tyrosine-type recombinase/integrase [Nonomuraea turcica]|uniref:tyrosine-type recombinase/integrase n=1 Tax=Nonomuraea sp. G32 TaxID=3067274 RepID=UPI00273A82C9|nr:tyrosine-type recombinase/integrase [Nonomuraea sp. G32]MDP4510366.1 tyrosine-type recombinase/integrase [Nonomuraea sp. G32]